MKTTGVSRFPKFGLLDFFGHPSVEAGEFSIFGGRGGAPTDFSSVKVFDDKNAGTSEIRVTEVAAREGWNLMKPLTAKMRPGGYLTGLPDPVVVITAQPTISPDHTKSKVIYLPEEKRRRYGNMLLDRYGEVSDQGPF